MMPESFDWKRIPNLEGDKIVLTELTEKDLNSYFQLCSQEKTMKAYGLKTHQTQADTSNTIELINKWYEKGIALRWAIRYKENPETVLGDIGFWQFDKMRHRGEIGAKIGLDFAGHGIASEATKLILEFAFNEMNLKGVDANVALDNRPSRAVLKKLKFQEVGIRPLLSYSEEKGEDIDMIMLSLNAGDWHE